MKILAIVFFSLLGLTVIYFYISWVRYEKAAGKFRQHLSRGARVKFLHHNAVFFGKVLRIKGVLVAVKEEGTGMIYALNINKIYPMLGKAKTTKTVRP